MKKEENGRRTDEEGVMSVIKITKKLLKEYRKNKQDLPLLEEELNELWMTDRGFGNSVILDYRDGFPRPRSIVGFDMDLYRRRETALKNKKEKVEAVEKWIDAIEDGQTRCVFRMYYIDGMPWPKIAQKTGHGKSPDYPRLMIRDKFLKEKGIK